MTSPWRRFSAVVSALLLVTAPAAGQDRSALEPPFAIWDVTLGADVMAAVDRELVPQVWSLAQPAFKERVAALQAKITKQ